MLMLIYVSSTCFCLIFYEILLCGDKNYLKKCEYVPSDFDESSSAAWRVFNNMAACSSRRRDSASLSDSLIAMI